MIVCSLFDRETGIVQQTVTVAERQLAVDTANALGLDLVDGDIDGRNYFIVSPEPLVLGERPNVTIDREKSLAVDEEWVVPVPVDTIMIVDGSQVAIISDGTAEISFGLVGVYSVELRPPVPGQSGYCQVTVTA